MPQENLNKIWNAGKYFEEPKSEQPSKQPESEPKPQNVKRKISVVKAFIPEQENPFKKKVEAVLKGIGPASVHEPAGKEKKSISADTEIIIGRGQDMIGFKLDSKKSIHIKGDAGGAVGCFMSGGEIYVEGDVEYRTGEYMSGGKIYVKGSAGKYTGNNMLGGKIHVESDAGVETGYNMFGGTLRIDGDVASFADNAFSYKNKGTIIWKGQTIWENGQQVEPGWTNLNVKEKIAK